MRSITFLMGLSSVLLFSCNNDETTTTTTEDSSTITTLDSGTTSTDMAPTGTPLMGEDSTFAMEAASGGMMEVEAGNMAQQNASSQRVKDFGAMMVRDHSQANNELKSLASSRNMMLPDSMSKKHRDHLTAMGKMTGKSFDKHYMSMMMNDHNKDISNFEKTSKSATDADLKAFAAKTLPVLKMHLDSVKAISKKM